MLFQISKYKVNPSGTLKCWAVVLSPLLVSYRITTRPLRQCKTANLCCVPLWKGKRELLLDPENIKAQKLISETSTETLKLNKIIIFLKYYHDFLPILVFHSFRPQVQFSLRLLQEQLLLHAKYARGLKLF